MLKWNTTSYERGLSQYPPHYEQILTRRCVSNEVNITNRAIFRMLLLRNSVDNGLVFAHMKWGAEQRWP